MDYIKHSAKGTTWKKGHKYLYKKNGKYYYAKPGKYNKDYNRFEDWWGLDEEDDYGVASVQKAIAEYNKSGNNNAYSDGTLIRDKEERKKYNKQYMAAVRNYNEKRAAYEKTPKGKFEKFIGKGKNFFNNILKRKK